MKLQTYTINQVPLTQIPNWSITELNGNPPFIVEELLKPNYFELTGITDWNTYGVGVRDYNFIREQIKNIVINVGFSNFSLVEKKLASYYFVVDKTDRDSVDTESEQKINWGYLVSLSQDSRFKRWEAAKTYVSYKLTPSDSSDLGKSTSELCNDYINYNIITKVKDGISGLFDYLKGEGDYVGGGYPSKSYWTKIDQDRIMDILENGNY